MTRTLTLPSELTAGPFTRRQAVAAGVPPHLLRSARFVQPYRGVYVCSDVPLTRTIRIRAAMMLLPPDAAASHHTGLELWGALDDAADEAPLHFSTNTSTQCRRDGIVLHRRRGTLHPRDVEGIRVLGPDRCFVDSATTIGYVRGIVAGDRLTYLGHTDPERIRRYADSVHIDGVQRARLRASRVRAGVESPRESRVRLLLVFARLPEPEPNVWIGSGRERLARGDLVYRAYRVVVEYDGRWHDDPGQQAYDELRRVALERAGWTVVVIKAAHLADPREIVDRVHRALVANDYRGPAPVLNAMWAKAFDQPRDL